MPGVAGGGIRASAFAMKLQKHSGFMPSFEWRTGGVGLVGA